MKTVSLVSHKNVRRLQPQICLYHRQVLLEWDSSALTSNEGRDNKGSLWSGTSSDKLPWELVQSDKSYEWLCKAAMSKHRQSHVFPSFEQNRMTFQAKTSPRFLFNSLSLDPQPVQLSSRCAQVQASLRAYARLSGHTRWKETSSHFSHVYVNSFN